MVGKVLWTWFFLIIWWRIGAPSGENQGKLFPKRPQPLRFSRSPKTCRTCFKHFGLRQIDGKWKTTWLRRSLVFLVDIGSHYLGLSENLAALNELVYHGFSPLYKLASSRLNIDPSGLNRSRIRDPLRMPKSKCWRNVALILVLFFSQQLPGCFSVPLAALAAAISMTVLDSGIEIGSDRSPQIASPMIWGLLPGYHSYINIY